MPNVCSFDASIKSLSNLLHPHINTISATSFRDRDFEERHGLAATLVKDSISKQGYGPISYSIHWYCDLNAAIAERSTAWCFTFTVWGITLLVLPRQTRCVAGKVVAYTRSPQLDGRGRWFHVDVYPCSRLNHLTRGVPHTEGRESRVSSLRMLALRSWAAFMAFLGTKYV